MMTYVYVILPLKLSWRPVYKAPDGITAGDRVRVIFAGKERIGVVSEVGVHPSMDESRILEILCVEPGLVPFSIQEIRFWEFVADYYMCSVGEVFKAACPEQKLRSELTAVRVADRAAHSRLRTLSAAVDTEHRRIDRMTARIESKKAALPQRREGTKARMALESDIVRLESELAAMKADLAVREAGLAAFRNASQTTHEEHVPSFSWTAPGKPHVLVAGHRSDVYSARAAEVLSCGGQVLILTPEKAFCSAIAEAVDVPVTVFSSDLSAPSRRRISDMVRSGIPSVIVGTRSALWLPWNGLRLVIIDEEQDTFYKQMEPAPRLHARDAAVALAGIHEACVLLGTSRPSLETRLNVIAGKYVLSPFSEDSVGVSDGAELIIDIPAERRKNGMVGPLSRILITRIASCDGPVVLVRGWEKPEELQPRLAALFPDRDISASGGISVMTLAELKREGCRGAQLLAVLQADALLSRDDFRADERALQLLAQLRSLCPRVIVQTAVPERFEAGRDDAALLKERKAFGYPPYRRMIDIVVSDSSAARLGAMSENLSRTLSSLPALLPEDTVMASRPAATSVMQHPGGSALIRILLHRDSGTSSRKRAIRAAIDSFEQDRHYPGHIIVDADPQ